MQDLTGKVAVITGASSGIGEATARLLAGEGVIVVLAARRKERMDALVEELGDSAIAIAADVGNQQEVAGLFDQVRERFGGLDLLFNNAGIGINGPFADTKAEEWKTQIDADRAGAFRHERFRRRRGEARRRGPPGSLSSRAMFDARRG